MKNAELINNAVTYMQEHFNLNELAEDKVELESAAVVKSKKSPADEAVDSN